MGYKRYNERNGRYMNRNDKNEKADNQNFDPAQKSNTDANENQNVSLDQKGSTDAKENVTTGKNWAVLPDLVCYLCKKHGHYADQ